MRALSIFAAAALVSMPVVATAQDTEPEAGTSELNTAELTETLSDPEFQDKLTDAMATMTTVLMDMPVGPLIQAAEQMAGEPVADVDPDATVRDLAGDDAEQMTEEVAERLPQMMDAMSGMAEGMAAMLPALQEMAKRMEGSFKDAS